MYVDNFHKVNNELHYASGHLWSKVSGTLLTYSFCNKAPMQIQKEEMDNRPQKRERLKRIKNAALHLPCGRFQSSPLWALVRRKHTHRSAGIQTSRQTEQRCDYNHKNHLMKTGKYQEKLNIFHLEALN